MIFDRPFATPRHDDDVFDSRGDRFFDGVLNERFVHQGKHFFGGGFSRGEKASAEAGRGDNGFSNRQNGHAGY